MNFKDTKLTLQSENLTLDWISFTIQFDLQSAYIQNILTYLSQQLKYSIITNKLNEFKKIQQNSFRTDSIAYITPVTKYSWNGVVLSFRGLAAQQFYTFIQQNKINWDLFRDATATLSRIDLCYDQSMQNYDQKNDNVQFLYQSCQQYLNRSKNNIARVFKISRYSYIYRIGNRRSLNYGRVYLKRHPNHLRYEIEIKDKVNLLPNLENLLLFDSFEEFEDKLVRHFYRYFQSWIDLENSYANWLVERIRRVRTDIDHFNSLMTTYLNNDLNNDSNKKDQKQKEIYTLLQFLSFLKPFIGQKQKLEEVVYYRVQFPFKDFLDYIGVKGNYQRNKIYQTIKLFQRSDFVNSPIVEIFKSYSFRSYFPIPYLECDISKKGAILVLWIHESLYFYRYSFRFPTQFIQAKGTNDRKLKLYFIQVISTSSLIKKFQTQILLNQFILTNKQNKEIRQDIIQLIHLLVETQFIQSEIEIVFKTKKNISNTKILKFHQLTPLLLKRSHTLLFKEVLKQI